MSDLDDPKGGRIVAGTQAELDAELRRLGVGGGIGEIRGAADSRVRELMQDLAGSDELRLAAVSLAAALLSVALGGARKEINDKAPKVSKPETHDELFFARPIEVLPDGTARAVGTMFYNRRWSDVLVHSSDMMFSCAGVVDALLEDGEEVMGVQSLRFLNPVQNDMELVAYVGDVPEDVSLRCVERKPDLKATFLTRNAATGAERKIQLFGFQNKQSASENPAFNGMAYLPASLSEGFSSWERDTGADGNDLFIFDLGKPDSRIADVKLGSVLNAVMELVMEAFSKLRRAKRNPFPVAYDDYNLAYGFDFSKLPKVEQLDERCNLAVSVDKTGVVEKENGFRLVPLRFFIKREGVLICEGVFTIAQAMNYDVAWKYSNKL